MRTVLACLALCLAAGCYDDGSVRTGLAAHADALARAQATIAAQQAQLQEQQQQIDLIRKARATMRLIVRATGEDLGPFIDFDHAWSEQGEFAYLVNGARIVYEGLNCTGQSYGYPGANNDYVAARGTATVWRVYWTDKTDVTYVSTHADDGTCINYPTPGSSPLSVAEDTGIPERWFLPGDLIAELR
jgi:hypothetical protein